MDMLDLATLLGRAGEAVSPEGSWQQRVGGSAAELAGAEQDRKYLADLLGGGMPDPSGRHGLSPEVVLQGLQLRHKIEQSRPKPVQMVEVDTPWGATEQVPAEDAPEYRRKIWAEQRDTVPTPVRTFREYQNMDEETRKAFDEFSKGQRGKTFEEALAEFLAKQRAAAKQDKELEAELELGTQSHLNDIEKRLDSTEMSHQYRQYADRIADSGLPSITRDEYVESVKIAHAEQEIEDRTDLTNVRFKHGPEGEGFYGINKDGEEVLHQSYQRRHPIKSR